MAGVRNTAVHVAGGLLDPLLDSAPQAPPWVQDLALDYEPPAPARPLAGAGQDDARRRCRVAGTVRAGAGRPYAAENRLPDHRVAGCVRQTWTRTVIAIAASAPTAAWASLMRYRSNTGECRLRELEQRMPPRRPQECRWWVIVPAGFQGPLLRQPSRCG